MKKKNKKNILIFIPKLCKVGGAEVNVVKLNFMFKKYFNVSFFTLHKGDVKLSNINCLDQKEIFLLEFIQMIPNAWRLARKCKEDNISVIVANLPRPNTVTVLSKILFGNKAKTILVTHSSNPTNKTTNKLLLWAHGIWMNILWNKSDKHIAVSEGVKQSLSKIGIKNVKVIYNPFDFDKIEEQMTEGIDNADKQIFLGSDKIFINVGRLIRAKGQKHLIDAFSKFNLNHPDTKLVILGDGVLRSELESQIVKLGMQNKIFLLGNKKNVFPYLKASHCFILSSLWEGLPTVLIEAIAVNIPVISTDCPAGPREILFFDIDINKKILYPKINKFSRLITVPSDKDRKKFECELIDSMEDFLQKENTFNNLDKKKILKKFHKDYVLKSWISEISNLQKNQGQTGSRSA